MQGPRQTALERRIVLGTLRLLADRGYLVLVAPGDKLLPASMAARMLEDDLPRGSIRGVVWRQNSGVRIDNGIAEQAGPMGLHTYVRRIRRFTRYAVPGTPDILGLRRGGLFFGLECKRPGQQCNQEQIGFRRMVELLGGVVSLITDPMQVLGVKELWR